MVASLSAGIGLLLATAAQADDTFPVRLVPAGSSVPDGARLFDLASAPTTYGSAVSLLTSLRDAEPAEDADGAAILVPLAIDAMDAFDLPHTTLSTVDAAHAVVLRSAVQHNGAEIEASLVVDWDGEADTDPHVAVVLHGRNVGLNVFNPSWPQNGIVPSLADGWLVLGATDFDLDGAAVDAVVPGAVPAETVSVVAGATFRATVDTSGTALGQAVKLVGLEDSALRLDGSLGVDGGLLSGGQTSAALKASLVKDDDAPSWLTQAGAELALGFDGTEAKLDVSGTYGVTLGSTTSTFKGGLSMLASATKFEATATLSHSGTIALPAPLDWVRFGDASLLLQHKEGKATAKLSGNVAAGASTVALDASFVTDGSDLTFELDVHGGVHLDDVARLIGEATGGVDPAAVEGLQGITLDGLALTVEKAGDTLTLSGLGSATIRGTKASLLLSAVDPGGTASTRILAGFNLQRADGSACCATLKDLLPSVTGVAGDLPVPDLDLVFMHGAATLGQGDLNAREKAYFEGIYGNDLTALSIRPGLSLTAEANLAFLGDPALDLLGLERASTVRIEGYVGTAMGTVAGTDAGDALGIELTAKLPKSDGSSLLPEWLGFENQWTLELKAVQETVVLRATGKMQARLASETLPEATLVASFEKDAAGVRASLSADVGRWETPFDVEWFTLEGVQVRGSVEKPAGGQVELHASLGAQLTISVNGEDTTFDVDIALDAGATTKVTFSAGLAEGESVSVSKLLRALGVTDTLPDGLDASVDEATLSIEHSSAAGLSVTFDSVASLTLTEDLTLSARLLAILDSGDEDGTDVTVGIRPEGDMTLGGFLPEDVRAALPPSMVDLEVPSFGLAFSTEEVAGTSSTELDDDVREFFAPLYGCKVDDPGCTFEHRLDGGVTVLGAIGLPGDVIEATNVFGLDTSQPALVRGTLPLFGSTGLPNLAIKVPMPKIEGMPEFLHSAAIELKIGGSGLFVSGELGVKFPRADVQPVGGECARGQVFKIRSEEPPGSKQYVFHERCYDLLTFTVAGGIIWEDGQVALNVTGRFEAAGVDGWMSPFGVGDWIGIKTAAVSFTGIPSTKTVALGMQADVRVLGKDLAGAINVALNIVAPSPPYVVPELMGFRVSSASGFAMQDIVDIQNAFAEAFAAAAQQPAPRKLTLDDAALPNVAVRNVDIMYARQTVPDLCLTTGLVIAADLYVNPTDGSSGPKPVYDANNCRKLPGSGASDGEIPCVAQKAKGCMASLMLQVTTKGVVGQASLGAFEIGALRWKDSYLSLAVTLNDLPHLKIRGAASIEGLFAGAVDVELSKDRMHVMGDVSILDGAAGAYVYGDASLDLTNPVIDVKVALHADFNNSIAKALDGPLRGVRTTTMAMDELWKTLMVLTQRDSNKVEVLKALPGQLRAAGVPVDEDLERIIKIAADIESGLKLFQGGSAVIHTVLNGIQFPAFQGWEIGYVPTVPTCLLWNVNGGCWLVPPVYIQPFRWFDLFGCFCWRNAGGYWDTTFAIPVPLTQPACVGEVHGGRCYALLFGPKPAWEIPGVCDYSPKMVALNRDCDLKDVVEQLVGPQVAKIVQTVARLDEPPESLTDFLNKVVGKLDGALNMVKLECAEFGLRLDGNATKPTADVSLAMRANVFGNPIGFGSKWNFSAPIGQSLDKTIGALFTSLTTPEVTTCVGRQRPAAAPLTLVAADTVNERGELVVTGTFADAPASPQTVTIEWGDGTSSTVTATQQTFTAAHAYADDEPSGVPGASMVIRASGGGATAYAAEHLVALANVPPTNIRAAVTPGAEGSATTLQVTFDDPSDLDSHQVQVDWGDGGGLQLVGVAAGVRSATVTHVYERDGEYPLSVSVVDDDTGRGSALSEVTVANDAPGDLAVKLAEPAAEADGPLTIGDAVDAPSLQEGDRRVLVGSFTDDGVHDVHQVVVDWGDGSPVELVDLPPGARTFELAHLWVDDTADAADLSKVEVTVRDDAGDQGAVTKDATVTNVAPADVRFGVAVVGAGEDGAVAEDGVAVEGAVAVIAGTFTDPGLADDHVVTISWGDGSATETIQVPAGRGAFEVRHEFVDDDPSDTPVDLARIDVTVTDDDAGSVAASSDVRVVNLAPTALTFAPAAERVDEAAAVTYGGTFADAGPADTFTVDVDWGDGTTDRLELPAGTRDFAVDHTYADDDLSGAPVDRFPVVVTITDDDTGSVTLDTGVDVHNVAPSSVSTELDADVVDEDGVVTLGVGFRDPGTLDTFSAVVDWGDGSEASEVDLAAGERAFSLTHRYLDDHGVATPSDDFTIAVTVTDDDTGVGTTSTVVTVDDVAPAITAFGPLDERIEEAEVVRFEGSFTDPGTLDTNEVVVDWGDGTEPAVLELGVGVRDFAAEHVYVDDDPTTSSSDPYEVTVTVTDDDTLAGTSTIEIAVHDVAPSDVVFEPAARVDEAATVTWNGAFADPGLRDTHQVVVDWGDGTDETVLDLAPGARTFAADHVYVDDDPTATPQDGYTATVTVTDDDGLVGSFTDVFTVHDVAPSALALVVEPAAFDEDGTTTLTGTFTDPGTLDTFTVLVDWGEGTVDRHDLGVGVRSFEASHQYGDDGRFPIGVTVTDDDTKSTEAGTAVDVANVAPTLEIDRTDPQWVAAAGGPTVTTRQGEPRSFAAPSFDPGSDDLAFTWAWGDGSTSTGLHRNAEVVDPDPSPTVGPREVTDVQSHAWAKPCLYSVEVDVVDDDGGEGPHQSAWVIATGTSGARNGTGWWHSRYDGKGGNDLAADVQGCYLRIAEHASAVFGDARPAGTAELAASILTGAGPDPRDQLDRTLLSLWLDYANGAFRWTDRVDTDGDGRPDAAFADVMQAAEAVRLDPAATRAALHGQRQRLQRTVLPGHQPPPDEVPAPSAPPAPPATPPAVGGGDPGKRK